ncbi:MAG: hypothetical protein DRH30_08860 [Deltaproteobacteria bacterium]|nr:MAG: hypothetical protein DRH30_08860 [Deltaproteobacteria bacterium]
MNSHRSTFISLVYPTLIILILLLWPGQLLAQKTAVTDPPADVRTPNEYYSVPFGEPLTIAGDQVSWDVPDFLLPNPIDNWFAGSLDGLGGTFTFHDKLPDQGVINGTGGTVGDPPDPGLPGVQDLLSAAVLENGTTNTLQILLRELYDPGPSDTRLYFAFNFPVGGPLPERNAGLFPLTPSSDYWAQFVAEGSSPFPYSPSTYYDIVAADVEIRHGIEILVHVELAQAPPSPPPETQQPIPYSPTYVVLIDADGDPNTGDGQGKERLFGAGFDNDGDLQPYARTFNGEYFELDVVTQPVASFAQDVLTLSIPWPNLLTIDPEHHMWVVAVNLVVGEPGAGPDDTWFSTVDETAHTGPFIFGDGFESGDLSGWSL